MFWFALATLGLLPAALLIERAAAPAPTPLVTGINCVLIAVLTLGPLLIVERDRAGSRTPRLAARLLLPLMPVTAGMAASIAWIRSWPLRPRSIAIDESMLFLSGAVTLVACGLAYLGIFLLGYRRFLMGAVTVVLLGSLLPPLLVYAEVFRGSGTLAWWTRALLELDRPRLLALSLAAYGGLTLAGFRLRPTS